ncbi:hypothetical protein DUNSADRAFT_16052 [Dunaliella salina]|uniref:Fungal lipase-type domain-containing protein n=1 Tax=Dunaliella salina TaxID=3046 RepID=A0ABQ7G4B0_DUNSA|nr:hypothetical protein DUNSADRAFT_16052 [Dunaliella salina]|eukprot:KAF5829455.1 hypothetical protein DUNSADRAFT_16052 [Dunaliella salina]
MEKLRGLVSDNFNPTLLQTVFKSCQTIQRTTAAHLPQLTWRDVGVAWIPLTKQHEQEVVHCVNCPTCNDHAEVMTWLDMCNWAMAAYDASSRHQAASILGIKLDDVLNVHCTQSAPSSAPQSVPTGEQDYLPAYFMAVDHDVKVVRVVVRGTSVFKDLLIDFNGFTANFMSGYAHCGMALASKALVEEELPRLEEALKKYPGYEVQFVGHSLGGGVAALAACYLNWDPQLSQRLPGTRVTAVTFASPPVLTKELASQAKGFIRAIINNNDMVPRASMAGVVELAHEILATKERLCEDHKVAAFMAGGAVKAAQEGRELSKALGETFEAASKTLFASMRQSAVEWREQQHQQQQQQPSQASRGSNTAGTASNNNSKGSSFFGAIASAAVGFIDATVPAENTNTNKQATPTRHSSNGGTHACTQSRSTAQPGSSGSAAGGGAAPGVELQQQQQERPCTTQQEDLTRTSIPVHLTAHPVASESTAAEAAGAEPVVAAPPDPQTALAESTQAAHPDPHSAQAESMQAHPQTAQAVSTQASPQYAHTALAEPTSSAPPGPHATQGAVSVHASSATSPSLPHASSPPVASPAESLDHGALDPQTQHLLQACADMDTADAKAEGMTQQPETDATAAAVEAAASAAAPAPAATPGCQEGGQEQQQQQQHQQRQQQQQLHHLYNPGVLHYIKRDGSLFHLYKDVPASQFQRVLIKQSSVDDHGINAYQKALTDLIFYLSSMPLK